VFMAINRYWPKFASYLIPFLNLLVAACGKSSTSQDIDLEKSLIGTYVAEKSHVADGDKVVENLRLVFYKSGTGYAYRWTYFVKVNNVEDTSKRHEESGTFTATETEITLVPQGGEPRTLAYKLLSGGEVDMKLTDEKGTTWNLQYIPEFWHG